MKKLKLKLDGKMLSKDEMKKVAGGYYPQNPYCDPSSIFYDAQFCCSTMGNNWCVCTLAGGGTFDFGCTMLPCDWACAYVNHG